MDPLADLLDGPRARGAFLLRSVLNPPWSLRIQDRAPLTLVAVVHGTAHVLPDTATPSISERATWPWSVVPTPIPLPTTRRPAANHHPPWPGVRDPRRAPLDRSMALGARTWGNASDGETVMLTGTYEFAGEISRRLLDVLPPLLVLPADRSDRVLIGLLASEITKEDPGQEAVLDRLLDLVLIATLRAWFSRPDAQAPGWYRAYADPIVGPALRLLKTTRPNRGRSPRSPMPATPHGPRSPAASTRWSDNTSHVPDQLAP